MSDARREPFADRLLRAIEACGGAPACVGLDPVYERIPGAVRAVATNELDAVERFSVGVLDAVRGVVGVVKAQSACFERYGGAGFCALERVCAAALERGFVLILDAKRADIGVSSEHYAVMAYGAMRADAVTLHPYMGADTIEPFLDEKRWGRRGVFVLTRTSNPGSDELQGAKLASGETVAQRVAAMVASLGASRLGAGGYSDVGAVIGATKPADAADLRARMPKQCFLVPGYGAQGGTAETVRALFNADGRGAVVTASRSVLYPEGGAGEDWQGAVRSAAERFAAEIGAVVRG